MNAVIDCVQFAMLAVLFFAMAYLLRKSQMRKPPPEIKEAA